MADLPTPGSPCLVCASPNVLPVVELPPLPIDTCRMWSSRSGACTADKARISLGYCCECSHVFNQIYDDELVDYKEEYENSQIFSSLFRRYAEELSDRLIATYDLHCKHIVEIGGGQGDFLRIICDRGDNLGVSFGPSYKPEPGDNIPANLRFISDYYTAKYGNEQANLIICRHVLEHFSQPRDLITTVRQAVGDRLDLVVYFEVPNGDFICREQAFWELNYQHCSYFTKKSLTKLFVGCGFRVRHVQESFEGQFLGIEACAAADDVDATEIALTEIALYEGETSAALCEDLATAFSTRVASWSDHLQQMRANRRRIIVWGAGAKAVTFLNLVDPAGSLISHVVDVNPRKKGRFISGSGQEIVGPSAVQELSPEVIILMNPVYRDEIGSAIRALGLDSEFLIA